MAENSGKTSAWACVDLGGSKIIGSVVDSALRCHGKVKISTKCERGPNAVLERIARCVRQAVDDADLELKQIRGVSVGAPGVVNCENGSVKFSPNLDWHDFPLRKLLEEELELPVVVANDGNLAMLGIYAAELKSKPRHVLGIFVGTGIGGGLILNGQPYSGFRHFAGEIGHLAVDLNGPKCKCGHQGCLETVASRTAIFQQLKAAVKNGQKTCLSDLLGEDLSAMRSGDLRKALRRGDKLVAQVVRDAARHIGAATASLANIFNPEVIVFGGSMIEALADDMLGEITNVAHKRAMPGALEDTEIRATKLGDFAVLIGGAVLLEQSR